ncbi:MAG: hypothetical protein V8S99_01530 [Oscillospiraceae bacterium]
MTGDTARADGLANFHNAFTGIYEARYVGGVVAGMKLQQLIDEGKVEDKNKTADGKIKIGYVGAYPYAEVVSGYTAFSPWRAEHRSRCRHAGPVHQLLVQHHR